jgi:copper(I)-binding protein
MLRALSLAVLLAALAACSAQDPEISASGGWARETGQSGTAAAYVTLDNEGAADQLVGVRSSIGEAMLHETSMDDGVMRMRPIDPAQGLVVPSNGKLALTPGGAHVMVTGLKQPLKVGDRFSITLLFGKSKPERVDIAVRSASEGMAH